ncbi:MAG: leucine--tRNA ligase, partial [bacterium]|nr:leucine--tRNA ligase [Candidatus Kapabacteria bacterium]
PKWQQYWLSNKTFACDTSDTSRPKCYVLDMFPYPSGAGLHVGHPEGYIATDIFARYKRHRGFNVLHPMGWDSFGLPAEQYAMKTNVHPRITTEKNIDTYRRQLRSIGLSYDWDREVKTTDPKYVRWTQWIFLKMYNAWFDARIGRARAIDELLTEMDESGTTKLARPMWIRPDDWGITADEWRAMSAVDRQTFVARLRLVYEAEVAVNWCEGLGSVLANEEVDEWTEKGYTVERRPMRQWMMRITAYAERLLDGLDDLKWPASTMEMQRNWIGRSIGAEIAFATKSTEPIRVFTTRPDTLFGVTFMTIAPEHPLLDALITDDQRDVVEAYRKQATMKSELDRQASEEKTGVFTGSYARHPANGDRIPVWTGDYVLASYGTGAVMGVPAHDERDFAFARNYDLPIRPVIEPSGEHPDYAKVMAGEACYPGEGRMVNSANFDGVGSEEAKTSIVESLGEHARATVQYKLRDWLFSRQRYWGEPIPIVKYENGIVEGIDESELPLQLPELQEFKPSGGTESPLALATDWLTVNHPVHGPGRRETNTMPQWAGSSWYYLRYLDPNNATALVDRALESRWMPIDIYIGGVEHAVLHLLYSRFWHKVLHDLGHLASEEPFVNLVHQGMILGEDSQKMSKSRGNVVNPDGVIAEFGTDSLRLFEMFMGPLEMVKPWSTKGVEGVRRFLNRAWRMVVGDIERDENADAASAFVPQPAVIVDRAMTAGEERVLHATIKKVTEDIEALRFNTAISSMMMFVNEFLNAPDKPREAMESFVRILSPFAPHISEEMWERLGHSNTVAYEPWPTFDESKIVESDIEIVLQVNSKIKEHVRVPAGTDAGELERIALAHQTVIDLVEGKTVRKVIAVKDKLVNVIAS